MKTLYLHIGTMKTGTTYIQHFLYRNRSRLKECGVAFPVMPYTYGSRSRSRNALFLSTPVYDEAGRRDTAEEKRRFLEGLETITGLFQTCDTVVMTDETLWFNVFSYFPDLWKELRAYSQSHGFRIVLIVYLRRQDEYLESWWNQFIKHKAGRVSWTKFLMTHEKYTCADYSVGLKKILEYFPQEDLVVRRYDRSRFPGGSIISDFLEIIGVEQDESFIEPGATQGENNNRLSGNMVEVKRNVNQLLELGETELSLFENACLEASPDSERIYPSVMLSVKDRKALVKQFEEGNNWIAEELIGDGDPLFHSRYKPGKVWKKDNHFLKDDIIRFSAATDVILYRKIAALEQEVSELKEREKQLNSELSLEKKKNEQFRYKVRHPFRTMLGRIRRVIGIGAVLTALLACAGCGESSAEKASSAGGEEPQVQEEADRLTNVSYDPTRELYAAYNELFTDHYKEETGKEVQIVMSHGGSGGQARSVVEGAAADVVTLALEHDITLIEEAGMIEPGWLSEFDRDSSPYTSTIVFLVRKGNEKNILDWGDLIKEDIGIITPDPKSSGGACWNFLAAWHYADDAFGGDEAQIMDFMQKLYANVLVMDSGARGSTTTFVENGQGDVLLAWENEALQTLREYPDEYELVSPSVSILAQPSVAVVDENADKNGTQELAKDYLDYLYSEDAQRLIGENGYRPSDEAVLAEFSDKFDLDMNLCTIEDFGGWNEAFDVYFKDGGVFDEVYGI